MLLEADRHGFNSVPPLCRGEILAGHFTYMSEPQFPHMPSDIRTPTPEALRGMQRDLIHQAQSLVGGGPVVGVRYWPLLAVSGGSSLGRGAGFLEPGTSILLACSSPQGYSAHPCPCNG